MSINSISLYCGSCNNAKPEYKAAAADFGRICAQKGITIYFGGASIGLMAEASRAARALGGRVIGIAPELFSNSTVIDTTLEELIIVPTMSERKQLLEKSADAFVVLPGGYGTLDELFEMLTDAQIGQHFKPVAILNVNNYYEHLIKQIDRFQEEGFLRPFHRGLLLVADNMEDMFYQLEHFQSPNDNEWLKIIRR